MQAQTVTNPPHYVQKQNQIPLFSKSFNKANLKTLAGNTTKSVHGVSKYMHVDELQ